MESESVWAFPDHCSLQSRRRKFRPYLAYSIWIETDRQLRLRRGLARDGDGAREQWRKWMAKEDRYVESERPAEHADIVIRGDLDLWR